MAQRIGFTSAAKPGPAGNSNAGTARRLVLRAMMFWLTIVLMSSQAFALQARSFMTVINAASAPTGARQLCQTYPWACSVSPRGGRISAADLAVIKTVNRSVNRSVRFLEDSRQHGAAERWSLPTARGGDCEDFALLKKQKLIQRGFPAQALLLATALDRKRRGHAVLIVRTDAGDFVLDNQTDRVVTWSDTGYIFLRMQNPAAPSRWVSVASTG